MSNPQRKKKSVECNECNGTGLFPKKNEDGTFGEAEGCPNCNGTGKKPSVREEGGKK